MTTSTATQEGLPSASGGARRAPPRAPRPRRCRPPPPASRSRPLAPVGAPPAPPVRRRAANGAVDGAVPGQGAPPAGKPAGSGRVRRIVLPVLLVLLIGGIAFGVNYYWQSVHFVSTDNAQITGQPVQVGALGAGHVAAVNVAVGATVHRGDVVAQVALPSQVGTSQSGTPKLEFLGAGR